MIAAVYQTAEVLSQPSHQDVGFTRTRRRISRVHRTFESIHAVFIIVMPVFPLYGVIKARASHCSDFRASRDQQILCKVDEKVGRFEETFARMHYRKGTT